MTYLRLKDFSGPIVLTNDDELALRTPAYYTGGNGMHEIFERMKTVEETVKKIVSHHISEFDNKLNILKRDINNWQHHIGGNVTDTGDRSLIDRLETLEDKMQLMMDSEILNHKMEKRQQKSQRPITIFTGELTIVDSSGKKKTHERRKSF
jgi:inorganic triphosphatase YgiF